MRLVLKRHAQDASRTLGRLYTPNGVDVICVTIERPWVDADANGKRDANVSRFVAGVYPALRRESPKRGYPVWWLCGVPDVTQAGFPDRPDATTAQIHIANIAGDLNGCIGVGSAFGAVKGESGVTGSRAAFDKLMAYTKDEPEILLDVQDHFPAQG